jgi:hypothetical protein
LAAKQTRMRPFFATPPRRVSIKLSSALSREAFANLRKSQLLDPAIPNVRAVPKAQKDAESALLVRLKAGFAALPATAAMAPPLVRALDQLLAYGKAIAYGGGISLLQAQTDNGGARYELGLGVRLGVPNDFIQQFKDRINAADPAKLGVFAAIAAAQQKRLKTEAASLDLILGPLGFMSAHQLNATEIYVSHLTLGGSEIDGPATVLLSAGAAEYTFHDLIRLTAAALAQVLTTTAAATGLVAAPVTGATALGFLPTLPAHDNAYLDRILPSRFSLKDQKDLATRLAAADKDTLAGLTITGAPAMALRKGDAAAWDSMSAFAFALSDAGVPALAVLVRETGDVVLLASNKSLPGLGSNLTLRQAVTQRWVATRLDVQKDNSGQNPVRDDGTQHRVEIPCQRAPSGAVVHCPLHLSPAGLDRSARGPAAFAGRRRDRISGLRADDEHSCARLSSRRRDQHLAHSPAPRSPRSQGAACGAEPLCCSQLPPLPPGALRQASRQRRNLRRQRWLIWISAK